MNILQGLIIVDIVLALVIFVIQFNKSFVSHHTFNMVLKYLLIFMLYHFVYVLFSKTYFPEGGWVENSAPFGLMYGPFIYFLLHSLTTNKLSLKQIIFHSLPYLFFLILQIIFLAIRLDFYLPIARTYMNVLYSLIPASFLLYGLWAFLKILNFQKRIKITLYIVLISNIIILFALVVFYFNVVWNSKVIMDQPGLDIGGLMIYTLFLLSLLSILLFVVSRSSRPVKTVENGNKTNELLNIEDQIVTKVSASLYSKSGLSESDLDRYENLLDLFIVNSKPWLDAELKLDGLAYDVKIPGHHLTQLLNMRKGKNFNEYINEFRIEHACSLLDTSQNTVSLEELGYNCGFNSKTTFYRWFKQLKQMTPAQYQSLRKSQ